MSRDHRRLTPLALCVFASGTASLGLEVVWSRLRKLVFGSTTLAVTTILVVYMLGLGLGKLLGGRIAPRLRNGVRAYGWIEVGVGLHALAVPGVLALYPELNRALRGWASRSRSCSRPPSSWARCFRCSCGSSRARAGAARMRWGTFTS
jgi:hypothetical protein